MCRCREEMKRIKKGLRGKIEKRGGGRGEMEGGGV